MLVFAKIESVQQKIASLKKGTTIGFVPTMGALHEGHISLVKKAQKENDIVVVSIFVNPTQFDKKEDLVNYPKTIDSDLSMLKSVYCDFVFTPTAKEMYAENLSSQVFDFKGLEFEMEGKFRKGHFDGVGTVVKRLFEIIKPHKAYFGEKDFQQLQIIKKMVEQEALKVKIVPCEIYREPDGLAMSSRNARLKPEYRAAAPLIHEVLSCVKSNFGKKSVSSLQSYVFKVFKENALLELEYFEIADEHSLKSISKPSPNQNYRAFIAVFAGNIRLIDNIGL